MSISSSRIKLHLVLHSLAFTLLVVNARTTSLNSLLASDNCYWASPRAVECRIGDQLQLELSGQGSGMRNDLDTVAIVGTTAAAEVQLPESPIVVASGSTIELRDLNISDAAFTSYPDPSTSLSVQGIQLQDGANLNIIDSTMVLDCANWTALRSAICDQGKASGDSQITGDMITIKYFEIGGIVWSNVSIPYPAQCNQGPQTWEPQQCVTRTNSGEDLLAQIQLVQADLAAAGFGGIPRVYILLQSPVTVLPLVADAEARLDIAINVTLSGYMPGVPTLPELDMNLAYSAVRTVEGGSLTLRNLLLVNMPCSPRNYPSGLLTSLPWFVEFRGSPSSTQLLLDSCIMVVPDEELSYLAATLTATVSGSWTAQPNGPLSSVPQAGTMDGQDVLTFAQVDGRQLGGSWQWISVSIAGGELNINSGRKIDWTGSFSSNMLLPMEDLPSFPLFDVAPLNASLNLSAFNVKKPQAATPPLKPAQPAAPVHLPQPPRQPPRLSTQAPPQQITPQGGAQAPPQQLMPPGGRRLQGPWPSAGDAAAAAQGLAAGSSRRQLLQAGTQVAPVPFNLSHLIMTGDMQLHVDALPMAMLEVPVILVGDPLAPRNRVLDLAGLASKTNGEGYITVGGPNGGPDSTLFLRSMVLVNLQAAEVLPASVDHVSRTLRNYTSLMWLFNVDRVGDGSDGSGLLGQIDLANVVLVVPAVELQVLRMLLADVTPKPNIDPQAVQLLQQRLMDSKGGSQLHAGDVPLSSLVDAGGYPLQPASLESDSLPGDVFFANLVWFGIVGTNVTFTAQIPTGVTMVYPVHGVILLPFDASSQDGSGAPADSSESSSSSLTGWRLGITLAGALLGAALLAGMAVFLYIQGRQGRRTAAAYLAKDEASRNSEGRDSSLNPEHLLSHSTQASKKSTTLNPAAIGLTAASSTITAGACGAPFQNASSTISPGLTSSVMLGSSLAPSSALPSWTQDDSIVSKRDTARLMSEIFEDVGSEGVPSSSASMSSTCSFKAAAAPGANPRRQMQQQMDVLCDELRGSECPWEVTGQLGKGAFGVVYKGIWRGLEVAIKRVIFQVIDDAGNKAVKKMALREAAINATLNHPNIVATYTCDVQPLGDSKSSGGVTDWQMYIIQECCDCGSLFDALQEHRFHDQADGSVSGGEGADRSRQGAFLPVILGLAEDIASGCAYIHSKQIIHGDLKPDNVLLKRRPTARADAPGLTCIAKVGDFGMSMNIRGNDSHISGVRHGTPLYIAPEILRDGKASKSADVYSFGVIMWELYHGRSAWQHLLQVTGAPPKKKRSLSAFHPDLFAYEKGALPAYAQLGAACLSEDPAARPTFEEVKQQLQEMQAAVAQQQQQQQQLHAGCNVEMQRVHLPSSSSSASTVPASGAAATAASDLLNDPAAASAASALAVEKEPEC